MGGTLSPLAQASTLSLWYMTFDPSRVMSLPAMRLITCSFFPLSSSRATSSHRPSSSEEAAIGKNRRRRRRESVGSSDIFYFVGTAASQRHDLRHVSLRILGPSMGALKALQRGSSADPLCRTSLLRSISRYDPTTTSISASLCFTILVSVFFVSKLTAILSFLLLVVYHRLNKYFLLQVVLSSVCLDCIYVYADCAVKLLLRCFEIR